MLRNTLRCKTLGFRPLYLQHAASTTAAQTTNRQDPLPISKVPAIPAIPGLGSGWVYLPLIGRYNFWKMHTANLKKYEEYGPIVHEKFGRNFEAIMIFDPEDIVKVHRNEGRYPSRRTLMCFKKYRDSKKDIYNNGGLLTTQGKEWWEVRSGTQPHMMKPKAIQTYLSSMDQVSTEFTDRMAFLRNKDSEIPDYLNELYKWAFESVFLVAFDARLGCIEKKPNKEAEEMINAVNAVFEDLMKLEISALALWQKFPKLSPTYRRFEKNMDYFSKKASIFLDEAYKRLQNISKDHEPSFLELMVSTTKDPRNITAMLTDMIFAGIDTTGSTMAFTLYHLARNPEVQEKVYQEIKSNVNGPLTVETLNNMPYLKACLKESMRLNPVAIGNGRVLREDTVLSGYLIPAGTEVFTQQYVVGRLDKYFPNAKQFRPERFLRNETEHDPFAYLPFGFGPRSCIGQRIAQQEMWSLLIRVLERFRIEYHHEEIDMHVRGIAIPDKPLRFQFFDR